MGTKLRDSSPGRDDLRELQQSAQADSPAVNLLNKKKLLPIVYALETGDLRTKRELGTIYFKRVLEPAGRSTNYKHS